MIRKLHRDAAVRSRDTLLLYWEQIKRHRASFLIGAFSIPSSSVFLDTITPYLLSLAVGTFATGNINTLGNYLLFAAFAAGLGVGLNLLGFQVILRHEAKVRSGLTEASMRSLLAKDADFFGNQRIGALTGKFIDFVNGHIAIQDLIILRTATFIINVGLGIILVWRHSSTLALIMLALVLGLLIQVRISRHMRMGLRNARKELVGELNGLSADIISNYATVKTFATEQQEISSLRRMNAIYERVHIKDFMWMSIEGTARIAVMQGAQILAIFIVGNMLMEKQIELGIAVFIIAYLQRLASQLFTLSDLLFGYDKVMLQAAPLTDILLEPASITDTTSNPLHVKNGAIAFTDVTYAYHDNNDTKVLRHFDLAIPSGQKVGLVGHSGAGKTTVTRLLLRFDDAQGGVITIDGQNIKGVTQQSLRDAIAYVPQEPMLFHRTLRENITYGKQHASEQEIQNAIKQANAHEFIDCLPKGLDTIVGERGVKLSGGQRQRIAIARAILKDAPILILDEATSALDSESEALIQQSLESLLDDRTSIVVAHRLSTLRHMDRIVVMAHGKIVEDGSHEELLALGGIYAGLWRRQSGGFIEE